jgi:NAD(P)-dependent dehydrogenase (short-subunit alcohol dehydrogenase family)
MTMKLNDKIVLVTGGTSGIGLAAVALFRSEGAKVVVVGTDKDRLKAAEAQLGDDGFAIAANLRHPSEIDHVIDAVRERYGRIDVVYANAGLGRAAPLEAVTEEQLDEQFEINFKGLFFTIQKAMPLMGKGGSIVLRSLARTLGAELAPRGIRVNAVSPGPISTPFAGKLGLSEQELKDFAEGVEGQVPLQRFGEADEVARAALFLASSDSSYVTGTEIVVDGGLSQF